MQHRVLRGTCYDSHCGLILYWKRGPLLRPTRRSQKMDRERVTNSRVTSGVCFFVPGFRAHFKDHKQTHFPGRVWPSGLIALTTDGAGGYTSGCFGYWFVFVSVLQSCLSSCWGCGCPCVVAQTGVNMFGCCCSVSCELKVSAVFGRRQRGSCSEHYFKQLIWEPLASSLKPLIWY